MKSILELDIVKNKLGIACIYPAGSTIYLEGERCNKVGVIIEGTIKLSHFTVNGQEIVMAQLTKNDLFGDFLIHEDHPYYPGDLIATEESKVAYFDKCQLDELLLESHAFRVFYLKNLSQKALKLNMHNKILQMPSLKEKVLFWMETEQHYSEKMRIKYQSKQSLADFFNVRRPSLSRVLKQLKNDNIIDYNRYEVWFKDISRI